MAYIKSVNPARNYEVIGKTAATSTSGIRRIVGAAHRAEGPWSDLGVKQRIVLVRRLWMLCKERASEIAAMITKEVGTPITASLDEVLWNKGYFEWFLDHAEEAISPTVVGRDESSVHTVQYEPVGTAAVITPWNLPFDMFVWGVIPNLLVGNTVVYKAAEECVLTGVLLEKICSNAGLPEGVLSFIHGGVAEGKALVAQDVDLIWFTGSTEVGQHLYETAGKKFVKAILEMGGSNPAIVFADADLDKAVSAIVSKRFMFCGQTCDADKRLLVEQSVFDTVIKKLKEHVAQLVIGNPEDAKTTLGPLVSEKQLVLLQRQVTDSLALGAKKETDTDIPASCTGAYYPPTILTHITTSMRVWNEEVFGPVLPVMPFSGEEEAVALANDTEFGLGSQIFTQDMKKAQRVARRIRAGNVDINGVGHFRPYNPFGGYKKSGMGREHGIDGFRELCQIKIVSSSL